jgi:hypothetical protein
MFALFGATKVKWRRDLKILHFHNRPAMCPFNISIEHEISLLGVLCPAAVAAAARYFRVNILKA